MTSTIISSIVLFLGVSILLVVILLVAKKYLVPSGNEYVHLTVIRNLGDGLRAGG